MDFNFEIYEGKSYKDLLKDIVVNTENKRDQLDIIVTELKDKIKSINDAIILAPIIQSYLETSVKNDDQLIKLSAILQRLVCSQVENGNGNGIGLTEEEKNQLLKDIKEIDLDFKNPINITKIEKK